MRLQFSIFCCVIAQLYFFVVVVLILIFRRVSVSRNWPTFLMNMQQNRKCYFWFFSLCLSTSLFFYFFVIHKYFIILIIPICVCPLSVFSSFCCLRKWRIARFHFRFQFLFRSRFFFVFFLYGCLGFGPLIKVVVA